MVVRSVTPRRCAGDEGAALVEAAFVTPVLLFLMLGILESGLLFRTYMAIDAGTQDGARTAAIVGNGSTADYDIIQSVQKSTNIIPQNQITNLVVFNASVNGATAVVPSGCATSTVRYQSSAAGSECNTYVPSTDWNIALALNVNYNCTVPGYSKGYCPTTRKVALNGPQSPPDYIGIYISVQHQYVSKLFGTSKTLASTTITRLEPQQLQS